MIRKIFIPILFVSSSLIAQKNTKPFNQWSIEANVGIDKPVEPYTQNYYSSNPENYFNISPINHYDLGVRYMMSDVFGLKLDFGYRHLENQKGSGSLPFESVQYSAGLQGVVNLGNLFNFNTFSKRINILGHGGIQFSQFTPKMGQFKNKTEDNGGIIFGLTPQFKISKRIVLTGDFSILSNLRQHYNWDGMALSDKENNLTGLLYSTSLGLTFYLGKKDVHADWYVKEKNPNTASDEETRKRIAELEKMLNDTDKDGVPDYLDLQNNTPNGVAVDTKGRFFDVNRNGVPDELENLSKDTKPSSVAEQSDAMRSLIEKGYLNIFFDVNQDFPNNGSTETVFQLIQFLKSNPQTKINLLGFADVRGGESTNLDLSKRRAQNVNKILIASGINKNRIDIKALGVDKSFKEKDKSSLDLARRVSVVIE